MWIKAQNDKELVNVIKFDIARIFGDKNNKAIIWGHFAPNSLFSQNRVCLGTYKTFEEANEEVKNIEKAIIENPNGIYYMKKNSI